jgi:hypothetical protein
MDSPKWWIRWRNRMNRAQWAWGSLTALVFAAGTVSAEPLLPSPSGNGVDATMLELARGYQRQQDVFGTAENGLSLNTFIHPEDVELVRSFFAQSASDDFKQVTNRHPMSVVSSFEEWGDEGNFAGVASVGVAARLMVLRRDGGSAEEIARARKDAIRAARAWHVYGAIGGPGVIARGIRRIRPENPQDPPLPGTLPETVPWKDDAGNPLPAVKDNDWREPVAPGFDDWIWMDSTSKDQVSGYALAVVWLYDALHGDPEVPADVTQNLANDLLAFARTLMQVAPETGVDLSIRDADGRLTPYHDLNPRELSPGLVVPEEEPVRNGSNAALALAIVRAAYHVSGDEEIGRWYYEELVGKRHLPEATPLMQEVIFFDNSTNFSNVNMLAIAWATLVRVETDPGVRATLEQTIEHAYWNTGSIHDVSHLKQAWFDAAYAAFAPTADAAMVADRIRENLSAFPPAPCFERDRINCDEQELKSGTCIAVDGTTIIHLVAGKDNGAPMADQIVPMSVRPDSDFVWRSNPFKVNGSARNLLDPRGDYLAAYWFARLVDRDPAKNISPNARPWPPPSKDGTDLVVGCGCGAVDASVFAVLVAMVALQMRRVRAIR